ncbi:MAG: hypothetical protein ABDH23_06050 [Endomicrobiia bacterium]
MKKFIFVILVSLCCKFFCFAINEIENINTPTAEIIDYGVGGFHVRLYSYGGVVTKFVFGPFNRVNFGGSIDIANLIGFETPKVKDPAFYFKWRVFDGSKYFPAFAIGYDGQSYNFISNERVLPKGLFLVFTHNLFSALFFDFGVNFTKYRQDNELLGFLSFRFCIEDIINFGIEYENIPESDIEQLNCKLSLLLGRIVWIDFIFHRLNSQTEKIERQLRINYLYKFF